MQHETSFNTVHTQAMKNRMPDMDDLAADIQGLTDALSVISDALTQYPIHDPELSRLRSSVTGLSGALKDKASQLIQVQAAGADT